MANNHDAAREELDALLGKGPVEEQAPEDSSPEQEAEQSADQEKIEEVEQPAEKETDEPFHKHPAWEKRERKWEKRLEETEKAFEERMQRMKQEMEQKVMSTPQEDEIPEFFRRAYGDDQNLYKEFQKLTTGMQNQIEEKVRTELAEKQKAESEKQAYYEKWVQDGLQELKDEGLKFDENELKKFMVENQAFVNDADGNLSFKKGYEMLQWKKAYEGKEKNVARKEVAKAASTDASSSEPSPKKFYTSNDLKGFSLI